MDRWAQEMNEWGREMVAWGREMNVWGRRIAHNPYHHYAPPPPPAPAPPYHPGIFFGPLFSAPAQAYHPGFPAAADAQPNGNAHRRARERRNRRQRARQHQQQQPRHDNIGQRPLPALPALGQVSYATKDEYDNVVAGCIYIKKEKAREDGQAVVKKEAAQDKKHVVVKKEEEEYAAAFMRVFGVPGAQSPAPHGMGGYSREGVRKEEVKEVKVKVENDGW